MRAILPGRPQSKRQAVCTAYWDGLRLVAYISGNTAVILRDPKDIVQTISIDHVENLSAITIDESSGRIAICDDERVLIFHAVGREEGDLRWTQIHDISIPDDGTACTLSWGSADDLLVGGTQLWLYHLPYSDAPQLIWQQPVANEISIACFSNDAEMFASCGQHDRLVKIWRRLSFEVDSTRFDVSYLPHPAAVIEVHWRKPWHDEHSLDSLLYTFCADGHIRVWSYSDIHSLSVLQMIATIDTNTSIEPRRRSIGSMSRQRHAFILDSRDFSNATEKAIQRSHNRKVDYALEHLIEIANRSPEFCVIFDGLGHMSVWGLENAGYKNRKPTVVFNVTLVDEVDIQLKFQQGSKNDYIKFCVFGGGSTPDSLSLLVHSYTGQVDWYESTITQFFDTSPRQDRFRLLSSWSGHSLAVDHIARGSRGDHILSWSDEGQAILWSQTRFGALRRKCEINTHKEILSVLHFDIAGHSLFLHPDAISLWNVEENIAAKVQEHPLKPSETPKLLQRVGPTDIGSGKAHFAIHYSDGGKEVWLVRLQKAEKRSSKTNGVNEAITKVKQIERMIHQDQQVVPCDVVSRSSSQEVAHANMEKVYVSRSGQLRSVSTGTEVDKCAVRFENSTTDTNVVQPTLARAASSGKCALVSKDRKTLTIWDINHSICEWLYNSSGREEIQKLVWTSTTRGNHFLFVGFSYHAMVVGQFRYPTSGTQQSAWYVTQNISLRSFATVHIGDVCWLSGGNLAVSAGNQIFVLDNVVTEHESPILKRSQSIVKSQSAAAIVDMANSVLPLFHPDLLNAIILQTGFEPAEQILKTFYEKSKYFSEGDELESNLGLSIEELFLNHQDAVVNGLQVNGDKGHNTFELEDVEDSFHEYLDNTDLWQLGPKKRDKIATVWANLIKLGRQRSSLDENALRYLYALYSTPINEDLPWSAYVFASRSNSHEALVDLINRHHDEKLTWDVARRTGLFVWLSDKVALQTQFENVARYEYTKQEDRNPVDCSLHYFALNKKSVLQSLWRRTFGVREKENTMKLLANNFEEPRWKATALKNAYALLSKRRFQYAAAFFLLGSSLKDAVNVCVNQLQDIQLAIAITRVWDKEPLQSEQVLQNLLQKHILDLAVNHEQGRWMASWAYTTLNQPTQAIQALVRPLHHVISSANTSEADKIPDPLKSMSFRANNPHLTLLYTQLRNSLIKQNQWTPSVLTTDEEWTFVLRAASWWSRAGMDYLALQLLSSWKFIQFQEVRTPVSTSLAAEAVSERDRGKDEKAQTGGDEGGKEEKNEKKKPPPTQFVEPSMDSLLDSFGF